MTADPEFDPDRLRRMEFAPAEVIDVEFRGIAEDFQVLRDPRPAWPIRVWRALKTDLINLVIFLTP